MKRLTKYLPEIDRSVEDQLRTAIIEICERGVVFVPVEHLSVFLYLLEEGNFASYLDVTVNSIRESDDYVRVEMNSKAGCNE